MPARFAREGSPQQGIAILGVVAGEECEPGEDRRAQNAAHVWRRSHDEGLAVPRLRRKGKLDGNQHRGNRGRNRLRRIVAEKRISLLADGVAERGRGALRVGSRQTQHEEEERVYATAKVADQYFFSRATGYLQIPFSPRGGRIYEKASRIIRVQLKYGVTVTMAGRRTGPMGKVKENRGADWGASPQVILKKVGWRFVPWQSSFMD